jgi:hypothetical protein
VNTATFIPVINETYTLTVTGNGNTYTATETLKTRYATSQKLCKTIKAVSLEPTLKTFYQDPVKAPVIPLQYVFKPDKIKLYVDQDEFFLTKRILQHLSK